ncbi:MAG: sulfatase-like hydrolase/transferase [Gammaproteobacteria bacterium]|nr:sulfatase-like hydrolase/transferase [Gammaproteobacteria bacterium]
MMAWVPDITFESGLFLLGAAFVQATLLSSPALLLFLVWHWRSRSGTNSPWLAGSVTVAAVLLVLFLVVNYKLRDMYGFYFNFFVLNLLMTPGGVEAMGVSTSTNITLAIVVLTLAVAVWLLLRFIPFERLWARRLRASYLVPGFIGVFLLQGGWYAWSEFHYDRTVLQIADRIIWYMPVTARTFFEDMGATIDRPEGADMEVAISGGSLNYPEAPDEPLKTPYNIVWLVAESWRADMLTPEIMPQTWAFAQKTKQFREHYSGGNGTRMGMFSQFYGLYGSYWFDFLNSGRQPLLMEVLQKNNYDMMAYTSSRFSYPEFDKTVFAGLPMSQLQSYTEGAGWERDRKNVADLLGYIEKAEDPFFGFMFFESAHANYYFPEESVIAPDYIEDFNYLTLDIEKEIERIRARYINANHHLDSQLGRVFAALEEQGKLDNTIVIVTGDHGEEFMENGRWGHNSTFSQEQIRVPFLLYVPGQAPAQFDVMTSHHDVPATVLAALGMDIDPATYSYGHDLLAADYHRDYTVASDWHGNTLITPDVKMVFSKKGAFYDDAATTLNDDPIDLAATKAPYRDALGLFTRELSRFYQ